MGSNRAVHCFWLVTRPAHSPGGVTRPRAGAAKLRIVTRCSDVAIRDNGGDIRRALAE